MCPHRKLSDDDIREIRTMNPPLKAIAEKFGVSKSHVVNIRKGRYHSDVK